MRLRSVVLLGAVVYLTLGGCVGAARRTPSPEPSTTRSDPAAVAVPAAQPPAVEAMAAADEPSTPVTEVRSAIATPNAGNGWIEIVIGDRPTPCGPYQPFSSSCDPAWRIRIDLEPAQQRPGQYALGPDLSPFSYRDAQGKAGGVWEAGADCKNLGSHFVGRLSILAIDAAGISGILSGAGDADGPFRAQRCPSCQGTGGACTSNGECCNDFCHAGRCQP